MSDNKYMCEYEYDANGKLIHRKNSNGDEWWYEYASNGKCVHEKGSDGSESWYDAKGNAFMRSVHLD